MSIEVLEASWLKLRCRGTFRSPTEDVVHQCDDHIDHLGSHHHAVDPDKVLFWPSAADIEDARIEAEIDAMSEEQIMATLAEGDKAKEEEVRRWAETSTHFVHAGVKMHQQIVELKEKLAATQAELQRLQQEEKPHGRTDD